MCSSDLKRGVGPQVVIGTSDQLAIDVDAALPSQGIDAIMGYLPVHLSGQGTSDDGDKVGTALDGAVSTGIRITPAQGSYDLFDLYDGKLAAKPTFTDLAGKDAESGLKLGFDTLAQDKGVLGLSGMVDVPWTADEGFTDAAPVEYDNVRDRKSVV